MATGKRNGSNGICKQSGKSSNKHNTDPAHDRPRGRSPVSSPVSIDKVQAKTPPVAPSIPAALSSVLPNGGFAWERLPGESWQAYSRFVTYRLTPPSDRSIHRLGISTTLAARWSKKWNWRLRVQAYDEYIQAHREQLSERALLSTRLRHATAGRRAVAKASRAIVNLPVEEIDAPAAALLLKTGVNVERQALGLDVEGEPGSGSVTTNVFTQVKTPDVSQLIAKLFENRPKPVPAIAPAITVKTADAVDAQTVEVPK